MLTGFVGIGLQMDLSTPMNQSGHSEFNSQWLKGAHRSHSTIEFHRQVPTQYRYSHPFSTILVKADR